jgi:hypothetical protein
MHHAVDDASTRVQNSLGRSGPRKRRRLAGTYTSPSYGSGRWFARACSNAVYAKLVGRENVIAGSDCGFGTWVGQAAVDPDVIWAKMAAMAEGARIASRDFWKHLCEQAEARPTRHWNDTLHRCDVSRRKNERHRHRCLAALNPFVHAHSRSDPSMTTAQISILALLMATTFAGAAESPDPTTLSASDETLIRELEARSWVAWKTHDAAFFEQFLSDDHVEVHGYGITDKSAVVAGVRSPVCVVQSYSLGPLTVAKTSTDSALVTYRAEQDTLCGGARVPSPVWATSLYVKRVGRWVNVLYQHTPAARG